MPREFQAFAPPAGVWGPWVRVAEHFGRAAYRITAEAIGNTVVIGEIKYFPENSERTEQFTDEIRIETSHSVAGVDVRFKGIPTGSAVRVLVYPSSPK